MMEVKCEQCGKHLIDTEKENKGSIAVEVREAGFIPKLPIFFGVTDGFHFFCCKDCWNEWFKVHCKHTEKGDEALAKIKEDIPKIAERCARVASGLQSAFEQLKQKRKI